MFFISIALLTAERTAAQENSSDVWDHALEVQNMSLLLHRQCTFDVVRGPNGLQWSPCEICMRPVEEMVSRAIAVKDGSRLLRSPCVRLLGDDVCIALLYRYVVLDYCDTCLPKPGKTECEPIPFEYFFVAITGR